MKIRCIEIAGFRGIKELSWVPSEHINCLIGAGDAGKTTILDAIELALAGRYQAVFDDADFFEGKHDEPIKITVTIGDLPEAFKALTKYGEHLRGWDAKNQEIVDEPDEERGLEHVLSVRLTIDKTLEPKWNLYTDRFIGDVRSERNLAFEDRQNIAPTRLGAYTDRHFAWGRQSILTRLTGNDRVGGDVLADVSRAARRQFATCAETIFEKIVNRIPALARPIGVKLSENICARLDVQGVSLNSGGVSLHDGDIPLRLLGTGSSRLLVAALQDSAAEAVPFALLDEVEHGLEPHRISRLLRYLKCKRSNPQPQVFLTTHSPVTLEELSISDIVIVRREASTGKVTVISAKRDGFDAQAQLRKTPSTYLSKAVLVCEGKTEVGVVRGLDQYWTCLEREPLATIGIWAANGGGKDDAPKMARYFHNLGYRAALFLDNDKDPSDITMLRELKKLGVTILRWGKGKATEDVLFQDINDKGVMSLLGLMEQNEDLATIPDQVNSFANQKLVNGWADLKTKCADTVVRGCLASCSKKHGWIKNRMSLAESIGQEVLGPNLENLKGGNAACIAELRSWIDSE